jgi:hypothetical protein
MYEKPVMTCFKYQVYLYIQESSFNALQWLESYNYESSDCPHPGPPSRQPPLPPCMEA